MATKYFLFAFKGNREMKRFEKPWRGREKAFLSSIVA
jgi:hypothetical protein